MIVYKYHFDLNGVARVPCSEDDKVVLVAAQLVGDDFPTLWIQHSHSGEERERTFFLVGTGHQVQDDKAKHVGSAVCADGAFIWHVYTTED